ncbi:hypothetical protein SAMN04515673_11524 [Poseidonocella sedimentorum]|uniref:Uncharacterized protein n=1 Tax=Poseidonocella sedimentorum TaxID=871652 RepID=A0A1I6EMD7_9RHOB|nr:hypothetical protein SAMN04515673_11524 [Poseidonocella sedimentorum]
MGPRCGLARGASRAASRPRQPIRPMRGVPHGATNIFDLRAARDAKSGRPCGSCRNRSRDRGRTGTAAPTFERCTLWRHYPPCSEVSVRWQKRQAAGRPATGPAASPWLRAVQRSCRNGSGGGGRTGTDDPTSGRRALWRHNHLPSQVIVRRQKRQAAGRPAAGPAASPLLRAGSTPVVTGAETAAGRGLREGDRRTSWPRANATAPRPDGPKQLENN